MTAPRLRLTWRPIVSFAANVLHDEKRLALVAQEVEPGNWQAIAIEASRDVTSLEGIFKEHAHHIVGEDYRSDIAARKALHIYGAQWRDGQHEVGRCDCQDIEATPGPTSEALDPKHLKLVTE